MTLVSFPSLVHLLSRHTYTRHRPFKDFLSHMSDEDSSMFNDLPGFVTRDFDRPAVHRVGWLRASDFVFSQSRRPSDNFPVCGRRAISFSFFLIKVLLIFQSSRHKNRQKFLLKASHTARNS